jgi:hypothetical protein
MNCLDGFCFNKQAIVNQQIEAEGGVIMLPGTFKGTVPSGMFRHTRRYYVEAVDALGQERFPPSSVWFQREWRAYYVRFVGEWHQ